MEGGGWRNEMGCHSDKRKGPGAEECELPMKAGESKEMESS